MSHFILPTVYRAALNSQVFSEATASGTLLLPFPYPFSVIDRSPGRGCNGEPKVSRTRENRVFSRASAALESYCAFEWKFSVLAKSCLLARAAEQVSTTSCERRARGEGKWEGAGELLSLQDQLKYPGGCSKVGSRIRSAATKIK